MFSRFHQCFRSFLILRCRFYRVKSGVFLFLGVGFMRFVCRVSYFTTKVKKCLCYTYLASETSRRLSNRTRSDEWERKSTLKTYEKCRQAVFVLCEQMPELP